MLCYAKDYDRLRTILLDNTGDDTCGAVIDLQSLGSLPDGRRGRNRPRCLATGRAVTGPAFRTRPVSQGKRRPPWRCNPATLHA